MISLFIYGFSMSICLKNNLNKFYYYCCSLYKYGNIHMKKSFVFCCSFFIFFLIFSFTSFFPNFMQILQFQFHFVVCSFYINYTSLTCDTKGVACYFLFFMLQQFFFLFHLYVHECFVAVKRTFISCIIFFFGKKYSSRVCILCSWAFKCVMVYFAVVFLILLLKQKLLLQVFFFQKKKENSTTIVSRI